jgi:hypothetical protein
MRENSPIFIYNLKDFTLLLSTYVDDLAIDMFTINNLVVEFNPNYDKVKEKKVNTYLIKLI